MPLRGILCCEAIKKDAFKKDSVLRGNYAGFCATFCATRGCQKVSTLREVVIIVAPPRPAGQDLSKGRIFRRRGWSDIFCVTMKSVLYEGL